MKLRKFVLMFVLAGLVSGSAAFAAEEKMAGEKMSPEKQAWMEKMKAMTTPNEKHKALDVFVGKWKAVCKFWMSPAEQPEVSEGTSDNRWIMDGRFIQQDFKGQAMGKPFEGIGITGYDIIRGEYTAIWLDNMATGIMTASGQYDATTKTFNQNGSMSCPLTMEKARPMRTVIKIANNDHFTYETYMNGKAGKEFKGMEITYDREIIS